MKLYIETSVFNLMFSEDAIEKQKITKDTSDIRVKHHRRDSRSTMPGQISLQEGIALTK